MTKRSALKRPSRAQAREMAREGVFDTRQFSDDAKVRRLPVNTGWSP